jgi:hypothetical protein
MDPGNGPPPPPHGDNPKSSYSGGLPNGNYDIFIIPPHSAGSGFLYLPSLRPQTNSFIAGVVCTVAVLYIWKLVEPILKSWVNAIGQSGAGGGILLLTIIAAGAGLAYGRNSGIPNENAGAHPRSGSAPNSPPGGSPSSGKPNASGAYPNGSSSGPNFHSSSGPNFNKSNPRPTGTFNHGHQQNSSSSPSAWEKAREETRRREEERRRAEDLKRRQEEDERHRTEADRQARAATEKEKWEQMRAREKEQRERENRESGAGERMANSANKETAERDARLKAAQERAEKLRSERAASEKAASERAKSERAPPTFGVGERTNLYSTSTPPAPKSTIGVSHSPKKDDPASPRKSYHHPTAQSYTGTATEHAFRPYDPAPQPPKHQRSAGSMYSGTYSSASDASESTAPSSYDKGPYTTTDETKIVIRGAYKFTDSFPKPTAIVRPGESGITDGLVMRMDTAGVFLDDDKKREPLRQWDIKAWTMKSVEVC